MADIGLLSTASSSSSSDEAATASSSDSSQGEAVLQVSDVQKGAGGRLFVHSCVLQEGSLSVGQQVRRGCDRQGMRWWFGRGDGGQVAALQEPPHVL